MQKVADKQVQRSAQKAKPAEQTTTKKIKLTCEKCKKKFSEIMALGYHKITFHVEAAPSPQQTPPASKPSAPSPLPSQSSATKRTLSKSTDRKKESFQAKTKKVIESDSDSESNSDDDSPKTPEPEMKKYADEKNKLSALCGIFKKKRFPPALQEPVRKVKESFKLKKDTKVLPASVPNEKSKKTSNEKPKKTSTVSSDSDSPRKVLPASVPNKKPMKVSAKSSKVKLYSESDS